MILVSELFCLVFFIKKRIKSLMIHFGSSCLLFLKSNDSNIISDITIVNHNHKKIAFNFFSCLGWIQEDRSGNSFAGGNGHSAKIDRFNKLTGDVYEEKPTFGTSQSTFRAAKIKCKKDNLLVLL